MRQVDIVDDADAIVQDETVVSSDDSDEANFEMLASLDAPAGTSDYRGGMVISKTLPDFPQCHIFHVLINMLEFEHFGKIKHMPEF